MVNIQITLETLNEAYINMYTDLAFTCQLHVYPTLECGLAHTAPQLHPTPLCKTTTSKGGILTKSQIIN